MLYLTSISICDGSLSDIGDMIDNGSIVDIELTNNKRLPKFSRRYRVINGFRDFELKGMNLFDIWENI